MVGPAYRIAVYDHGNGLDLEAALESDTARLGPGLRHAQEQLRFIGGEGDVASGSGDGTQTTVVVPKSEAGTGWASASAAGQQAAALPGERWHRPGTPATGGG